MMPDLRQFLPAIPPELQSVFIYLAGAGAVFGVVLWLMGSRFSRSLVTLVAVAVGSALGLRAPRWLGLEIGTWATAVGGALLFGLVAYIAHGTIIKIGLGLIMGAWAAAGAWLLDPPASDWKLPAFSPETELSQYAQQIWQSLPVQLRTTIPGAYGIALAIGLILGVLLPRLAVAIFYSALGLTLAIGLGGYAAGQMQLQLLGYIPQDRAAQLITFSGLALGGAALQWWLLPRPASRKGSSKIKKTPPAFSPTKEMDSPSRIP